MEEWEGGEVIRTSLSQLLLVGNDINALLCEVLYLFVSDFP